jgi:hypothetical protein
MSDHQILENGVNIDIIDEVPVISHFFSSSFEEYDEIYSFVYDAQTVDDEDHTLTISSPLVDLLDYEIDSASDNEGRLEECDRNKFNLIRVALMALVQKIDELEYSAG